jgi:uncharacterized OB-fold protein
MSDTSAYPDLSTFEIQTDVHTQPFWVAAAEGRLIFPRCSECHRFRWPPGPLCAACRSQQTQWLPAGTGRIFSYTIIPAMPAPRVVGLIEFPEAGNVRLTASIVDTSVKQLRIGAQVDLSWIRAANANIPVFRSRDF